MTRDSREGQKPKFKAILIGGPCDGQTYGMFEDRSVILAVDYSKLPPAFLDPVIRPEDFGPKPSVHQYVLRHIAGIPQTQNSSVRTYIYDKMLQEPND